MENISSFSLIIFVTKIYKYVYACLQIYKLNMLSLLLLFIIIWSPKDYKGWGEPGRFWRKGRNGEMCYNSFIENTFLKINKYIFKCWKDAYCLNYNIFFQKIQNLLTLLHIILCGNCSSKCDFQPSQKKGREKKWRTCEQK